MKRMSTSGINTPMSAWTPVDIDPGRLFGIEKTHSSSEAQKEIFSASFSDPDSSRSYNHSISIFLEGALDVDALYSALLNLLSRHEALRGCFSPEGETFRVREAIGFSMPVLDLSAHPDATQKILYDDFIRVELDHLFDLVNGPLFRSTLVRHSASKATLIFNTHHIVVDGWSLKIILDDLPRLYSALVSGTGDIPPSASFLEYLDTALAREKSSAPAVRKFWKKTFEDGIPALDLPVDRPRPLYRTFASRREDYSISHSIYEKLKETGAKAGVSQFITLFSAFALYLHRISGQADFVLGVPAAGQITSGKAKLLGHDARVLPIRVIVAETDTFKTFSKRLMERFLEAYDNQWISMPALIKELKVQIDPARVPLVPVLFNFDPGVKSSEFRFEGLKSSFFFNHRNAETFEISINAVVENGGLVLECAYNDAIFDSSEMHERLVQLENLMESIAAKQDEPVARLALLKQSQIELMDHALNHTGMEFERDLCVEQLVARIVMSQPERIAVEFADTTLDYGKLWELSGKIATSILAMGLEPKPLVGVMLDRSEAMVPVLLGIWRAGGAFVPLDPGYPIDRLQYMVDHSGIRLILTQSSLMGTLNGASLRYRDVASIFSGNDRPFEVPFVERSSNDLAYVIYTSGSTGLPKGVKVPQRALNNFLTTMKSQAPGISPEDRVLAITTLSFDIAELEIWLPLISGARVVLVDRATAVDGLGLIEIITRKKVSFIQATPATWRLLLLSEWQGNPNITALCGGEALPRELASDVQKRVGKLWNVYGPTETTVWSTLDQVTADGAVTIGKPIGNTQAYVLDGHGAWVPRGVVGELWLGGEGVTDGYLGRDDLTVERYVPNRFTGRGQIYKTGDLVRLRLDGRIEYVGRNDFQVKVRGFRIELGEVQHALARNPAVQQCVAVVSERTPGDAHLVAYYTLKAGLKANAGDLKSSMKGLVPDYMIPGYFVELTELPLTQNGKINIKALPTAFAQLASREEEFLAPKSENEIYLARLWSEIVGVNRVGRKDHFLAVGGSSLQAIRIIQRVLKERAYKLTPKAIFVKSLEQLAAEMSGEAPKSSVPEPVPVLNGSGAFFGAAGKKKFGYFYPGAASAGFAVLVCPPFGQEYMRSHWLIRNLSTLLNEGGVPVLRFDYFGHGDSMGLTEEVRLKDLCDSIVEAAQELKARSGASAIKLVAFRASSLFVDRVAGRLGVGTGIVFVDPVVSGLDYVNCLRQVQRERWAAYPFKKSWISTARHQELLGSLYSRDLIDELESLKPSPTLSAVSLVSAPSAGWDDWRRLEKIWLSSDLNRKIREAILENTGGASS